MTLIVSSIHIIQSNISCIQIQSFPKSLSVKTEYYLSYLFHRLHKNPKWTALSHTHMNRLMTKPIKWLVRPTKTQISMCIRPVWSGSSQWAKWVSEDPVFLQADSEDFDQTGRMSRLIWVFAGHKRHFVCFVKKRLKWSLFPHFWILWCRISVLQVESKKSTNMLMARLTHLNNNETSIYTPATVKTCRSNASKIARP